MKTSLSHLPKNKQEQILQTTDIIKEVAVPEKVILFGSYAKGKQVEHRYTGKDGIRYEYISDFDFLVVTKNNTIKEYELEDIINNRTEQFEPSINLQIHEIDYINEGLEFGQYFFTDIVNEGILLYDTGTVNFTSPRQTSAQEEKEFTKRYFELWFPQANEFIIDGSNALNRKSYKKAAFEFHQATESLYYTTLLVLTGYKPKTHNLWKLRKHSKDLSEELYLIFPVETNKVENHLFDLLKRGYIDAGYKDNYIITEGELVDLLAKIKRMQLVVKSLCETKISSVSLA